MKIKMDSRAPLILACCMLSIVVVLILFMVSFHMSRLSCDLVFIEPDKLRSEAVSDWKDSKPSRSQEKSMLIKLAAHLEYFNAEQPSDSLAANLSSPTGQAQQQQQIPGLPIPVALDSAFGNQTSGARHPQPSIPQSGFSSQQLQTSLGNSSSMNSKKKRFQQLVLEDVRMERADDEYKYSLRFSCSTITLVFIRRPERVHVKQVHVELKPANSNGKSSCELALPAAGAFEVEVNPNDHLAHYYCDKPLRYSCYHYQSRSAGLPALHLADLLIHKLEFELPGNNSVGSVHKNHSFLSKRSK